MTTATDSGRGIFRTLATKQLLELIREQTGREESPEHRNWTFSSNVFCKCKHIQKLAELLCFPVMIKTRYRKKAKVK